MKVGFQKSHLTRELKKKADALGIKNITYYGKNPILYAHPSNESWIQFCKRKINE